MDELLSILVSSGPAGIVAGFLYWQSRELRNDIKEMAQAHKVELAEKDRLILELQTARLAESREGWAIASKVETTLATVLVTIKE